MNQKNSNAAIKRLRLIGILEGISYLVLLGIAMPLKYMADMPAPVKYVGWAHGLLFVLFVAAVANAAIAKRWSVLKVLAALVASVLPFGPFILDAKLLKQEEVQPAAPKQKVA
ncbi:DUF3817 domain-containing protein [Pontibacter sp. 172403-2]|uniref:DUF3817 domain-containing protein n=1 Tax=Pontibacter rufus TaxID=2791028 RepID=UPI0018AF7565|nr:DUF3817 domain-containing protein [Pontibacter sp. 172403-2]MBF9255331.1 DUF3817 domain-containing protein [Pontibacter sp. 172403-2]